MQLQTDKETSPLTTMPTGLTDLPEELLELVVSFLDGVATLHVASSCSLLYRIATQQRVWETLKKRSNLVIILILVTFLTVFYRLCFQVTVSREARREVERRRKSLDMKESPVDTLRNSYILCNALRKNWGSGLLKENILLDEKTGLELGYSASPCARTSASTVAVVCDSKNEAFWSGNLSEPTPATLRLWDLGTNSRASPEIHYNSLSYHTHFVLDDFVVVMGRITQEISSRSQLDLMVVSIQDHKILFTKEKTFNIQNFMRGFEQDSQILKNTIASFRQKTITLHQVTKDDVTVKVLDVGDAVGRGMLQYSKFFAWDETFLAHPFQSMGMANEHVGHPLLMRRGNEAMVEHKIFCWDEENNWSRKEFLVPLSRVNDIHDALAIHQGKLFALQNRTTRVWQIESGELLSTATLTDPLPIFSSYPNPAFNSNPRRGATRRTEGFLLTDGIGVYLQPQLGLVVGLLSSHHGKRPVYIVVVFNLDWHLVGSMTVPEEKDLAELYVYLVGPRVVLLYNDNSYSVLDLESFQRNPIVSWNKFPSFLPFFPLGTAKKEGSLVSQQTLQTHLRNSSTGLYPEGFYTVNCVKSVSDINIVVSHVNKGRRLIQSFSFL